MFRKMLPWLITILIAITLIIVAAFLLNDYLDNKNLTPGEQAINSAKNAKGKPLSAQEIKENTVMINEILTNLSDTDAYIRLDLAFELDSKKAKVEFEQLDFKVKAIILQTLADMTPAEIEGSIGRDALSTTLINKINLTILTIGKLKHIYITNFLLNN